MNLSSYPVYILRCPLPGHRILWAAGYNIFAIPLAAGVLANWGILLSPAVGALLMSVSTIVVAINAQLLRRTAL
jgi:Cu2+-exporting ATPase